MPFAIFGITNDGLNLAASLILLMLVALYVALVVYTFFDARRRVDDPVLVAVATVGSLIPFIGTAVYAILRPPEYLEDARERGLEIQAAELRVRQLAELACPNCNFPVEKNYLRCPNCQRRLKDPCHHCGKPVDPRWALCPYCETSLPGRSRQGRSGPSPDERREPRPARGPARSQGGPKRSPAGDAGRASGEGSAANKAAPKRRSRPKTSDGDEKRSEGGSRRSAEQTSRSRSSSGRDKDSGGGRGGSGSPDSPERS